MVKIFSSILALLFANFLTAQIITFNKCLDINEYGQSIPSVNLDSTGNYILYGSTLNSSHPQGMGVVVVDSVGDIIRSTYYFDSTKAFYGGLPGSCVATSDGNYVHGSSVQFLDKNYPDFLIGKFNAEGDTLWQTIIGTEESERGLRAIEGNDNSYILIGNKNFGDSSDACLVKVSSDGEYLWEQTYGGLLFDGTSSILTNNKNGFLIAMSSDSYGINGGRAIVIIETDSIGDVIEQHVLYPEISGGGSFITYDSLGGIILTGTHLYPENPQNFQYPFFIARADSNYQEVWKKVYSEYYFKNINNIRSISGGQVLVYGTRGEQGSNNYFGWIELLDIEDGSVIWSRDDYHFSPESLNEILDVKPTPDGGFIVGGRCIRTDVSGQGSNMWLMKLDSLGNWEQPSDTMTQDTIIDALFTIEHSLSLKLYPNPATEQVHLQIDEWNQDADWSMVVYDLQGRVIKQAILNAPQHPFSVYKYLAGVYFVSVFKDGVLRGVERLMVE